MELPADSVRLNPSWKRVLLFFVAFFVAVAAPTVVPWVAVWLVPPAYKLNEKALTNAWLGVNAPNLLAMVFVFGLVHGFGLSTRLQEMTLADDPKLLGKILSFNLGVELGQVLALSVMALLLRAWKQSHGWTVFSRATNGDLIAAGVLLLVMQLHGYGHQAFADSFPINRDDHAHAHEEAAAGMHSHDGGPMHTHAEESHSRDPSIPKHD